MGVFSLEKLSIYSRRTAYTYTEFYQHYRHISAGKENHVLLESGRGGRYSMAAFDPEVILTGRGVQLKAVTQAGTELLEGNPLHCLKEYMGRYEADRLEELPDFQGGAIGYISYDYARYVEKLPVWSEDDLELPDVHFFLFREWFVFDHEEEELWLLFLYDSSVDAGRIEKRADDWVSRWTGTVPALHIPEKTQAGEDLEVSMKEEEFKEAVSRIQDYISKGDVFQVNLSVRQTRPIGVEAINVYDQLRQLNPSPYMAFIHTPDYQIVSGSPELLVKKNGQEISTRPIAGTRSRGADEAEDLRLAEELIQNEKERAEHVMLVDLERNDLGRVAEYGSVEVNEFMVIEKYSHVMHIVSNVRGVLAQGKSPYDVIDAVFPGGTITGAPKIRTMEIIEELEPVRRGLYTGSIGWIGFNGDMELNIVIRTMLVKDGKAHVQAGAGIVIDSNPKHEYKESLKKAMALWKAKELAENGGEHLI